MKVKYVGRFFFCLELSEKLNLDDLESLYVYYLQGIVIMFSFFYIKMSVVRSFSIGMEVNFKIIFIGIFVIL